MVAIILEYRLNYFVYNLIKIRLANYTELANYIALGVAGNNLAFDIAWFTEITCTHPFFERIAILGVEQDEVSFARLQRGNSPQRYRVACKSC